MTVTWVTRNAFVRSGSAVARKPVITQACRPAQTRTPTGLPVSRIALAALFVAAARVGKPTAAYGP